MFLSSVALGAELSIEIQGVPVVSSGTIRLHHLARIACDQPDLLIAASRSEVNPQGETITPKDVVSSLAENGIGGITLKLTMADSVPYRHENALEFLLGKTAGWSGTVEIVSTRDLPSAEDLIDLDRLFPGAPAVNLKFRTSQGEQTVPVKLRWLLPAVVAQRPIKRGATITPSDLAIATIEYQRNRQYYSNPRDLVGMEATRDTAKDQPFTARITNDVEIIRSGSTVRIIHKRGSLIVSAPGRAMESGSMGDVIKVRNQRTRSVLSGTVTGPDTVEVVSQ